MKMWTLHGALSVEKVVSLYLLEAGGRLFRAWDSCERRTSELWHPGFTSEMEVGACVLTQVPAERRTAQPFGLSCFLLEAGQE